MKQCPNGHDVSDNDKFCSVCGAGIIEKIEDNIRFCKKCGRARKENEKFCPQCGSSYYGKEQLPIVDKTNMTKNQYFSARRMLSALVLCILFIGGYFVYCNIDENHSKEIQKKRMEAQLQEQQRIEEERKKVEEDNMPAKRLYNIATQGKNVFWGTTFSRKYVPSSASEDKRDLYTVGFFLRPLSENSGELSYIVLHELNFDDLLSSSNLYAVYTITDNVLKATLEGNYRGNFLNKGETISMKIENDGDNVKLVGISDMAVSVFKQMEPVTQKGRCFIDPQKEDLGKIIGKMNNMRRI